MTYQTFEPEDFASDAWFLQWVTHPDARSDRFWQQFLTDYPEKEPAIREARKLIQQVAAAEAFPADEALVQEIWSRIEQTRQEVPAPRKIVRWKSWARAAAVVLIGGAAFYAWQQRSESRAITYRELVQQVPETLTERVNTSSIPLGVDLPDGSRVWLDSASRISFPSRFAAGKREVYLTGAAFFDVRKNPKQPFLVYAGELVTRVLGTSFRVQAYEGDGKARVIVRTGRVSVSTRAKETPVVLLPDQLVTLDRQELIRSEQSRELPVPVVPATAETYRFRRTSVAEVFRTLEKHYGVQIVFDPEKLRACQLTAELTDESLADKIDLICHAINGSYERVDGRIFIYSDGCNE